MKAEEFKHISATIPLQPGIYKYYDDRNELIYVGKAKNLRKRVISYFTKTFNSRINPHEQRGWWRLMILLV